MARFHPLEVVEVRKEARPTDSVSFVFPDRCPVCGGELEDRGQGIDKSTGERIQLVACSNMASRRSTWRSCSAFTCARRW